MKPRTEAQKQATAKMLEARKAKLTSKKQPKPKPIVVSETVEPEPEPELEPEPKIIRRPKKLALRRCAHTPEALERNGRQTFSL